MRFILIVLVLFLCLSNSIAQGPASTKGVEETGTWGTVKDGRFVSERLKLSLPVPAGYSVISTVESEILTKAGADIIKQGSRQDKQIDEAVGRTIKLIAIAEKPFGESDNSALELVAAKQPNGVTANMSLAANLMVLRGSPLTLKHSLGSLKLGSNIFAAAELDGAINQIRFKQRMYVVMHNGYSIICAVTYSSDSQLANLEKALAALSLAK